MFASLALLAAASPVLAEACKGRDGWNDPAPPVRIHGSTYYVGTCGITALLITSKDGHVLIDGGTREAAPRIAANIARLGFRVKDVKYILNSHEHHDHAGGIAELQRRSGATVLALPAAVQTLGSGQVNPADPQKGLLDAMVPVAKVEAIREGQAVRLGPLALTAHATTGHAPGSTSWSWRSCQRLSCVTIVYADSVSSVSAETYRFSDHPDYVANFRTGLNKLAALKCDMLITPHPSASNFFERLAGKAPLVVPGACRPYAEQAHARLDQRLAREKTP